MDFINKRYPAKVLLFGEYTVIHGGDALTIPLSSLSASWKSSETKDIRLVEYIQFIKREIPDFNYVSRDLVNNLLTQVESGLVLESNIPFGAGLGSSGALTAAIYDAILKEDEERSTLENHLIQEDLAIMESYFHGSSSGLDPLTCFLNTPIYISNNKQTLLHDDLNQESIDIYVYNSLLVRRTKPLVDWYNQERKNPSFKDQTDEMRSLNALLITRFLNKTLTIHDVKNLSTMQFEVLAHLIPDQIKQIWKILANENIGSMKLCGAGGGGSFLIFTKHQERIPGDIINPNQLFQL